MQKRTAKRRRVKTRKLVARPGILSLLHRGWKPGALALLIACMWLAAYAASRNQPSTIAATTSAQATNAFYETPTESRNTPIAQQTAGVLPLSVGGPIPVPANVFHPTNIARVIVNDVMMSIYAGSMARAPDTGALVILRENLKTGQQSLHMYETTKGVGALTIVGVRNGVVMLDAGNGERGEFDLGRGEFRFLGNHQNTLS
ncbi:MAG TPA: hypothetical protein VFA09_10590 [Ktedonobacteraceae bacterium]|nr:hypothetical protein [Ktedonobacteraceae bacterium]